MDQIKPMQPPIERFKMDGVEYVGVLFRASRQHQILMIGAFVVMSMVLIGWGVTMTNPANQFGLIGMGVIIGGVGVISIRNVRRGVAGIGVTESGLIWALAVGGVYVVRWDQIAEIKLYPDVPGKRPTGIGLNVEYAQSIARSRGDVDNLNGWRSMFGWHLRYERSSLVDSLETVMQTIDHFGRSPDVRPVLNTPRSAHEDGVWPPPPSVQS